MKENELIDYQVKTKVALTYQCPAEMVIVPQTKAGQEAAAKSIRDVFAQDETLSEHIRGDLNFTFEGDRFQVEYTFNCADEPPEEAEGFSESCLHDIQGELERQGFTVERISCAAEEMDMSWLGQLEDQIFGMR